MVALEGYSPFLGVERREVASRKNLISLYMASVVYDYVF